MFHSIWKEQLPVSVAYISSSTHLHDVYVYVQLDPALPSSKKQQVIDILQQNKGSFDDMLQITLRLPVCSCGESSF